MGDRGDDRTADAGDDGNVKAGNRDQGIGNRKASAELLADLVERKLTPFDDGEQLK